MMLRTPGMPKMRCPGRSHCCRRPRATRPSGRGPRIGWVACPWRVLSRRRSAAPNPWLFTGTEHLMGVFFTELAAQLSDLTGSEWDELGASMQAFGATLSRLRTVPVAGGFGAGGGGTLSSSGGGIRGAADEGGSLYGG